MARGDAAGAIRFGWCAIELDNRSRIGWCAIIDALLAAGDKAGAHQFAVRAERTLQRRGPTASTSTSPRSQTRPSQLTLISRTMPLMA